MKPAICEYWEAYGGWPELLKSRYFHAAVFTCMLVWGRWTREGWWEDPIGILPNLIGFSFGAFAMLISFGDDDFRAKLSNVTYGNTSVFTDLRSAMTHFVVVQLIALLLAIVAKGIYVIPPVALGSLSGGVAAVLTYLTPVVWGVSYLTFIYSIFCGFAATFRAFRLSGHYQLYKSKPVTDEAGKPGKN